MAKGDSAKQLLTSSLDMILPGAGTIAGSTLGIIEMLANPSDYNPVKYNDSNFQNGGPINPYDEKLRRAQNKSNKLASSNFKANIFDFSKGKEINKDLAKSYQDKSYWKGLKTDRDKANTNRQQRQKMESVINPILNVGSSMKDAFYNVSDSFQKNFNKGGSINDKQLSSTSVEIDGKGGVDTNKRNVLGNSVNLTDGETISMQQGSAEVYSDSKDMPHPLSGKTFAETVKPIQKSTGRAERKLSKFGGDKISKNTIKINQQILEVNKALQDRERTLKDAANVNKAMESINKYYGGSVMNKDSKSSNYFWGGSIFDPKPGRQFFDTYGSGLGEGIYSGTSSSATSSPTNITDTQPGPVDQNSPLTNTTGDILYTGGKTIETLGRVFNALDAPEQFATDRYDIDRIKLSAQDQLDANNRSFRAGVASSSTGNASMDRIMANTLFATKIGADNTARRDLQNRQSALDLDVQRNNMSQKAAVDQINSQTQGAKAQAIDSALSSIGSLGQVYMDMFNTSAQNRVTVSTLNSLSRYYGIDTENLIDMMKTKPDEFDSMLTRFKEQNPQ